MDNKYMTSIDQMSQEQLAEYGAKVLMKAEAQAKKDKWYTHAAKFELKHLRQLVKDNDLTVPNFPLTKEDYIAGQEFDFEEMTA